ncbi:MAG: DNA translocase FtsK 4TM domain-containing protein [Rickettsiales bacterium]|jgi:S-DNA-T family DNA segregation ATPase FtsK/SpoIIIE|nr:DNA translocase FtsK 4TM domain-containing protein [Rickettsiales bacterium]
MRKFRFGKVIDLLLGISSIVLAIFLFISILTYSKLDPSFNTVASSSAIFNKMGLPGAYVADLAIQLFGVVSFFPIVQFFLIGVGLIRSNRFKKSNGFGLYSKVIASIVFIISSCALLSKVYRGRNYFGYETYGGAVGYYVGNLMVSLPNNFLLLLYSSAMLCSLHLMVDFSRRQLNDLAKGIARIASSVSRIVAKFVTRIFKVLVPGFFFEKIKNAFRRPKLKVSGKKLEQENYGGRPDNRENKMEEMRKHMDNLKTRGDDIIDKSQKIRDSAKPALLSFLLGKKRPSSTDGYKLPPLELLNLPNSEEITITKEELKLQATNLLRVLKEYKITGKIISVKAGPIITLHEFEPSAGTKSSRIIGCADDIARNLKVESTRISVIPERNVLGIELPNKRRNVIFLRDILELREYKNSDYALPTVLGSDIAGSPVIMDLARAPHLLIAGTTGSGKSVCVNTIILSLLYKFRPEECKLIMIDPKMLELSAYEGIPHLLVPVVTDSKKAIVSLKWVVNEMENRYRVMSGLGVRNIYGYNEKVRQAIRENTPFGSKILIGYDEYGEPIYTNRELETRQMPFIVVFVDEMADLMITAGKEIEALVQRIAQMARAAGIHMVMATQRPSVDVITGVIKANFPSRISFLVSSRIDSKVILGEQGAEQLLGMGDMLYMQNGGKISRAHGPFVSDIEVERVVNFIVKQGFKPEYVKTIMGNEDSSGSDGSGEDSNFDIDIVGQKDDETLYHQAIEIVKKDKKTSISYLQRQLRIGYNKSASLIERMEREGIISPIGSGGKRDILK